jgi:hypothetical protein
MPSYSCLMFFFLTGIGRVSSELALASHHVSSVAHNADVVSIAKTNENFRLLYDSKVRFKLHHISAEEPRYHQSFTILIIYLCMRI